MAETGEMVGVTFLSICVTVGQEPTGNLAGTYMEEPMRSPRKPTGNPPETHPKPYLKQRMRSQHRNRC